MSDADAQRSAKALQEIAHHLKELVKIQASLNENVVTFIRDARVFAEQFNSITLVDEAQMTLDHIRKASEAIHEDQKARRGTEVDPSGMVVGPDGKARPPFHEDPLVKREQPAPIFAFNVNDRVWIDSISEHGVVTTIGAEREGRLYIEVELERGGSSEKRLFDPEDLEKVDRQ